MGIFSEKDVSIYVIYNFVCERQHNMLNIVFFFFFFIKYAYIIISFP